MIRTIEIISDYDLSSEEIEALLSCWIINWCGGKNWLSFDNFFEKIEELKSFNSFKLWSLKNDIKVVCYEHDIDYRFKKGFYSSNYRMTKKVYQLLNWTTGVDRFFICVALFFLLNKYWKKYYNLRL